MELQRKFIPGYNNQYEIDEYGNIYSFGSRWGRRKSSRKMQPFFNDYGYLYVNLSKNGKLRKGYIARLVAIVFIRNLENKREINHKDGIKTNNHISNLEWVTRSENVNHAIRMGLKPFSNTKLNYRKANLIRKLKKRSSIYTNKYLGKLFSINESVISRIVNNKAWRVYELAQ